MSTSPNDQQEEGLDKQSVDELADTNHATDEPEPGEQILSLSVITPEIPLLSPFFLNSIPFDANACANRASSFYRPNLGTSTTSGTVKRGRGRPKGSKNKKSGASSAGPESPTTPTVQRKRGRPPKEKKEDAGEEPPPKRPRGRPPKNPKPASGEATTSAAEAGDSSGKKKRGRPSKKGSTA
ncbi:hypothetical protein JR316_0003706 [Psilocybe cubensis]|uniref:Uncharacterized protein n=2 Tax=Psilocybe cubensis TaxID=181762 RepID=A0ACB8H9P8_PSICU|nr:hypothetical protein JR316_0003706 [Psilocybe cubensis]KAH9484226.1 hypothetical protein JR316_0003706 [Psilocybe cubensis]